MIQIKKPTNIPSKLKKDGLKATKELIDLYQSDPEYKNGVKKFKFKSSIYGHKTVKNALRKAQFSKCCFCERKTEIGDVEHFRGKGGYQQSKTDKLIQPGYFWLAYEWDNLYFSCEKCNRSYKRSFFPLVDNAKRATAHTMKIEHEEALLIDPSKDDPEDFLEFIGINIRSINGNEKGSKTIERIGLDRPFLDEDKLTIYKVLKTIFELSENLEVPIDKRNELKKMLSDYTKPKAEYSVMIKCAIRDEFKY